MHPVASVVSIVLAVALMAIGKTINPNFGPVDLVLSIILSAIVYIMIDKVWPNEQRIYYKQWVRCTRDTCRKLYKFSERLNNVCPDCSSAGRNFNVPNPEREEDEGDEDPYLPSY